MKRLQPWFEWNELKIILNNIPCIGSKRNMTEEGRFNCAFASSILPSSAISRQVVGHQVAPM
jgi:hypothetical protein